MKITEAILAAKAKLEANRGRKDIKLDELVQQANDIINLVIPPQPSDRVAEVLNERTLRYYITEGLIDRPSGKEGTAALYSYRHLLQALIVKALQAAYLPMKRIKELLAGRNDTELEAILACQSLETPEPLEAMAAASQGQDVAAVRQKASDYLNSVQESTAISDHGMIFSEPRPDHGFSRFSQRRLFSRPEFPAQEFPSSHSWERFVLDDGLELHVRTDRLKELRSGEIKRLLARLLNLLKNRT